MPPIRKTTLLVVDDDPVWVKFLSNYLTLNNYSVFSSLRATRAHEEARNCRPDCVLLDFHMPDAEADEVCRVLRADKELCHVPIIIVSADPCEEINAYAKCQADNFILKDVNLKRITAAIESLLRRVDWDKSNVEDGDLRLETETHLLYRNSKPLFHLSPYQFQLLALLIQNVNEFVPEETLNKRIYNHSADTDHYDAIKMLLHRLRVRLGPQLGRRIKNKRRLGWIYLRPGTGHVS